jgi:hypothetical protein
VVELISINELELEVTLSEQFPNALVAARRTKAHNRRDILRGKASFPFRVRVARR